MSKIKLTGDTSGYVEISAPNAAGNNTLELPATGSKIVVSDSSDNLNVAGILTSVGALNVGTGGTVITTTASGLVGLNSTSPAATIDIRTAPQWSSYNYGADLVIGGSRNNSLGLLDSTSANPWTIANTGGTLTVATMPNLGDTSTAPTNRMQIGSGGDVTVNDGNLVIGTSGHGIDFSATSDAGAGTSSEILDDYEEGTWTPTFVGFSAITYTAQSGAYVKIGRMIYVYGRIAYSSRTSSSNVAIVGLPFGRDTTVISNSSADLRIYLGGGARNHALAYSTTNNYYPCTEGNGSASTDPFGATADIYFHGTYTTT